MKKICLLMALCFVLSYSSVSYAIIYYFDFSDYEEYAGSDHTVYDEDNNCTSGMFRYDNSNNYRNVFKFKGDHIYLTVSHNESAGTSTYKVCRVNYGYHWMFSVNDDLKQTVKSERELNLGPEIQSYTPVSSAVVDDVFATVPIFNVDDAEAIKAYVENGDVSGAINADYCRPPDDGYTDEHDDSIPLPHNLKVLQGADQSVVGDASTTVGSFTRDVVLSWEQSDVVDGMSYEIEFQSFAKRMPDDGQITLQEHNTPYYSIVKASYGANASTVTVSLDAATLNSYKEKGFLTKQNFRVRNVVNKKTSNWVLITIDIENGTATATEQDYSDNSNTGGDEYDGGDVGNGNGTNTGNVSVSGLMTYIQDGFGLLGNGGIIALMSQTFLYLPNSIWVIIKYFISMLITISIIGAVVKIIF